MSMTSGPTVPLLIGNSSDGLPSENDRVAFVSEIFMGSSFSGVSRNKKSKILAAIRTALGSATARHSHRLQYIAQASRQCAVVAAVRAHAADRLRLPALYGPVPDPLTHCPTNPANASARRLLHRSIRFHTHRENGSG